MARTSGKTDADRLLEKIGTAVRERRTMIGLSQEALADTAGIDRSHMGKIERGERNVTVLILGRIVSALGCSLSDLIATAGV